MNLPFVGFPLAGTLRERLRSAHKDQALSEVETRQFRYFLWQKSPYYIRDDQNKRNSGIIFSLIAEER
ncbi:MAG TPA: hypothetical protein V6C84_00805 [Coleofasciculaceae cyanobacterium]|jgi:predicted Zn-dependent protease